MMSFCAELAEVLAIVGKQGFYYSRAYLREALLNTRMA